jgi:hypothetical protein
LLDVSVNTIHGHRNSVMAQLNIHKQADLVHYAIKAGIANEEEAQEETRGSRNRLHVCLQQRNRFHHPSEIREILSASGRYRAQLHRE